MNEGLQSRAGKKFTEENQSNRRETRLSVTLFTTNTTWTGLPLNLTFRDRRPMTDCLS
jgi:hypothetical protein